MSGDVSFSHASKWSSRCRTEFTFQVAMRIKVLSRLRDCVAIYRVPTQGYAAKPVYMVVHRDFKRPRGKRTAKSAETKEKPDEAVPSGQPTADEQR
jgi:hypothetical protein